MSAERLKGRLHLRIEQVDANLRQIIAELAESLFTAHRREAFCMMKKALIAIALLSSGCSRNYDLTDYKEFMGVEYGINTPPNVPTLSIAIKDIGEVDETKLLNAMYCLAKGKIFEDREEITAIHIVSHYYYQRVGPPRDYKTLYYIYLGIEHDEDGYMTLVITEIKKLEKRRYRVLKAAEYKSVYDC
jgi:hypothetical protein